MPSCPGFSLHHVLILKADRFSAETLRQATARALPAARLHVVGGVQAAATILAQVRVDLLLLGVNLVEGDALDFLASILGPPRRIPRVLVVAGRSDLRLLERLRTLPIDGVFDPFSEGPAELEAALPLIAAGRPYWSANVVARLSALTAATPAICRMLTPAERMVFALIGDGIDNREAAAKIGVKPASIHAMRRELHRKLGLRHRGALVSLAAQSGFVRFTPEGVERPGFAQLLADARPPRRADPPAKKAPACDRAPDFPEGCAG